MHVRWIWPASYFIPLEASSSRSIAISSSLVPCTLGPVNHFLPLKRQYKPKAIPEPMISGAVKLKLFCLKNVFPAPSSKNLFFPPRSARTARTTAQRTEA